MLSADAIRRECAAIRAATMKPFNVNFFCHTPAEPDALREEAWRAALRPYYDELGLDATKLSAGPARRPFDDEAADVIANVKPPVVSFHFGLPSDGLLARVRATGAKVISSATTVDEARWLEARGVDAIIAQGVEAGGHRGMFLSSDLTTQVGTFALVPQIVAAVRVPVIAAGGIADARGVEAAMKLGAAGVQVGTAYLLCREAQTTPIHRAALKSDAARHTALTNVFSGRPARGIVNRVMREIGPSSALAPEFPMAGGALAPLRSAAEAKGSGDFSPLWSGENATGCREVGAGEMTRMLAGELLETK
jgi:nitronate monooxygenase